MESLRSKFGDGAVSRAFCSARESVGGPQASDPMSRSERRAASRSGQKRGSRPAIGPGPAFPPHGGCARRAPARLGRGAPRAQRKRDTLSAVPSLRRFVRARGPHRTPHISQPVVGKGEDRLRIASPEGPCLRQFARQGRRWPRSRLMRHQWRGCGRPRLRHRGGEGLFQESAQITETRGSTVSPAP